MSRHLLVLIFEPAPGNHGRVGEVMRSAHARAVAAGWHCWAYRNDLRADELTLFLEGPAEDGDPPVFGDEIQQLRALSARFEPVRSLAEVPLEVPSS